MDDLQAAVKLLSEQLHTGQPLFSSVVRPVIFGTTSSCRLGHNHLDSIDLQVFVNSPLGVLHGNLRC